MARGKSPEYPWGRWEQQYIEGSVSIPYFSREEAGRRGLDRVTVALFPTQDEVYAYALEHQWVEKREAYRLQKLTQGKDSIDGDSTEKMLKRHIAVSFSFQRLYLIAFQKLMQAIDLIDVGKLAKDDPTKLMRLMKDMSALQIASMDHEAKSLRDLHALNQSMATDQDESEKSLDEILKELEGMDALQLAQAFIDEVGRE